MKQTIQWKKLWTRDFAVQYFYMPVMSLGRPSQLMPHPITDILVVPEKNMRSIYVPNAAFGPYLDEIRDTIVSSHEHFDAFVSDFYSTAESLLAEVQENAQGVEGVSDVELLGRHSRFMKAWQSYGAYLWVTFYVNEQMAELVANKLKGENGLAEDVRAELVEYAARPSKPSGILLLEHEAREYSREELLERFRWLSTLDVHTEPLTASALAERLLQIHETLIAVPACIERVSLPIRASIERARAATALKDVRDDYRRKMILFTLPVYDEIAKRTGVPRQELSYLTCN